MEEMKKTPLKCKKYNYSLDEVVQNFSYFDAFIKISNDEKEIIILNQKPRVVRSKDFDFTDFLMNLKRTKKNEKKEYTLKVSASSFSFKKVKGIIFGGISSRFWMYKKHINLMSLRDHKLELAPFYAWQCVTIELDDREIDLVI